MRRTWALLGAAVIGIAALGWAETIRRIPEDLKIISKTMKVPDDTRYLYLSGLAMIDIVQSGTNELTLEGTEDTLRKTIVEMNEGHLEIRTKTAILEVLRRRPPKLICTLKVKDLSKIVLAGYAQAQIEEFKTNQLNLEIRDDGRMTVHVDADFVSSYIDGKGQMFIGGSAGRQLVVLGGSGLFQGRNFISEDAQVTIYQSGSAYVNVTDTLDVTIKENGSVFYLGKPQRVTENILSSGKLIQY